MTPCPGASRYEVALPDGSIRWQQWADHAIVGSDGRVTEFQAIGQDITDRKRAEEARRNLAHATRVSMLGALAGSLAHELNQPLTAILSNAQAGSRFLADVVITALRDAKGTLVGFAKVTRDLTARRAAEEQARRLSVEKAQKYAAQDQAAYDQQVAEQQAYAASPPAAPAAPDYAAELERLAQLKTQGIITDEEFEAKKKQILGI